VKVFNKKKVFATKLEHECVLLEVDILRRLALNPHLHLSYLDSIFESNTKIHIL